MGTLAVQPSALATTGCHDELLSMPGEAAGAESATIPRVTTAYEAQDERFLLPVKRSFDRQYAQLYFSRLQLLQSVMAERVAAEWPGVPVTKILGVGEDTTVAVIGTLYKDMSLKPSILDEYSKDPGVRAALGAADLCSDGDGLVLEDEGARMALRGSSAGVLEPHAFVTGVVLAVRGRAEPGGDFVVDAVLLPGLPPQPARPPVQEDMYVAIVSGLQLASGAADVMRLQLLVDFLTGNLGATPQQALAAKIVQLVVAGGTLGQLEQAAPAAAPATNSKQQAADMEPVRDMDMIMTELAAALPVDIMPGPDDPANVSLPQQPLHACLFPGAAPYSSFRRTTNPHAFALAGGISILGSSGQAVNDMALYTRGRSRLQLLADCLQHRHLAPTAPDTLTCFPFSNDDPFVVSSCPHVMFTGNQPTYQTSELKGPDGQTVRLICVPSFLESGTIVLLNLRTLECQPLTFEASFTS